MKHTITAIALGLFLIASIASAQVDKATGTNTNDATHGRLRLAHLVYGGPNVDWYVDGEIAVNGAQEQVNIPVGYLNGYLYLEPGTYSFTVTPTGQAMDEAILGPVEVAVVAGHRYTLAMMGQVEDASQASLLIDETAELQKIGASTDQVVYFLVNNVAGTETLGIDEDGHGATGIRYGDVGVATLPGGKYEHYAITFNGDPTAVLDSGDYGGYGERPGTDVFLAFVGHYPGELGTEMDYFDSSPSSNLNTLELLRAFTGSGFEADFQEVTFDTFLAAVETAGLTELLSTGDPLLVLPPTDAAFAALPKDQLDALMADPQALGDLLRNHIVEAYVPKGALATTPGGPFDRSFTNLLGGTTHIGGGYTVNGLEVGDIGSIFTANGTQVHPITRVLLPPTILSLAVSDGEGAPSEALVNAFVDQVRLRSDGNLIVEPVFRAGDVTFDGFEKGVVQLVNIGTYDLGLAAARSWDTESITSFQALQAPFLITNDALAEAVATSDIAMKMLDSLSSFGFVGLTLWPEDLRHPFSVVPGESLLSPDAFAGLTIRATPSFVTYMLMDTLQAIPMLTDSDYQGAESGLRQGFSLTGTPTATGNVVFFPKFQVLFANGAAFEKLTDAQRTVLREAAAATQQRAIAEHPREVDNAAAWCADGGSIVLASDEQVAAFETASQPIFDQIAQDPLNAELIAAIRDLKASTEPSPGAMACSPTTATMSPVASADTQAWEIGLPPNGTWRVELTAEDLIGMGLLRSTAEDWSGVYTWVFQDGKATFLLSGPMEQTNSGGCEATMEVVEDYMRLTYTSGSGCDGEVDDIQWRLDDDGLHLHLVNIVGAPLIENRAYLEAKPWQKIE